MGGWMDGYMDGWAAGGPEWQGSIRGSEESLESESGQKCPLPPGPRASESVCQAEIAKLAMCRKLVVKGCSGSGHQHSRASVQRVCERAEAEREAGGLIVVAGKC